MCPVAGITNAAMPATSRKPSSRRLPGSSARAVTGLPVVRFATASATSTTSGQPSPSSSRLDPVMLAAAYCT
jgi:hypothetical protein